MICNRCVKQDVCRLKVETECAEDMIRHNYPHLELDCRHREPATSAQMEKVRREEV